MSGAGRFPPLGQALHLFGQAGQGEGSHEAGPRQSGHWGASYVGRQREGEGKYFLEHHGKFLEVVLRGEGGHVHAVQEDFSFGGMIQTAQELHQGGLSCAVGAHQPAFPLGGGSDSRPPGRSPGSPDTEIHMLQPQLMGATGVGNLDLGRGSLFLACGSSSINRR